MDANGSNIHRITDTSIEEFEPSRSPDGKKIVFTGILAKNKDIWVVNADGSNLTRLTDWSSAEVRRPGVLTGRK
jgi:TolB protein